MDWRVDASLMEKAACVSQRFTSYESGIYSLLIRTPKFLISSLIFKLGKSLL